MKVSLFTLVGRNIKLFWRDKMTMFFSLLAPIITLVLFILFLRTVQIDAVGQFMAGFGIENFEQKYVEGVVHGWFISGVLAVSIISVGLSFFYIMIRDKENGIINDFLATPTSKNIVKLSYLISAIIVDVVVSLIIFALGIIYLIATGTMFIGFVEIILTIANIIMSSISACIIMMLISSIFTKESQFGGFTGIISAVVGFVIGAYMPVSTFPTAIQYVIGLVPGSYSAAIFRNILVPPALDKLNLAAEPVKALTEYFSLEVNFFGATISYGLCYLFLALSIIVFGLACFFIFKYGKTKKAKQKLTKPLAIKE